MKNLVIPAKVAIAEKTTNAEFSTLNGDVIWHGAPKRFAQPELNGYRWHTNANIGPVASFEPSDIEVAVRKYLEASSDPAAAASLSIAFEAAKEVRFRGKKAESDAAPKTPAKSAKSVKSTKASESVATVAESDATAKVAEPTPAPVPASDTVYTDRALSSDEAQLIDALKRMRGTAIDEGAIRGIVLNVIAEMAKDEKSRPTLKKAAKKAAGKEFFVPDFDKMVEDLRDGDYIYMHGPAGCGKTHTAKQLADALGIPFYSQTTIQFAHDVKGYGSADGKYIGTPFYEAFAHGGLYHQDEYDRSYPEAAIALNTALANGYFDFPVIGRVEAHPDFRFCASGNTTMKGADDEYVSGQVQDASSIDRFACFYAVGYDHALEVHVTEDEETVLFCEDVRNAIRETGIKHVVSYRASKYMAKERCRADRESTLVRCTFKGLEVDEMRIIYGALKNKDNAWAKSLAKVVK